MVAGICFTLAYIVYFQFGGGTKDQLLFGITPEGIGFVGMILNFVVAFLVSGFTAKTPEEIVKMVQEIRVPSDAGDAQEGH